MSVVAELQLLNRVLDEKNWGIITENNLTEQHFPTMKNVYNYIETFRRDNGVTPTADTVLSQFDEFELIEQESIESVVKDLREDLLHRRALPVLQEVAQMIGDKRSEEALHHLKSESIRLLRQNATVNRGYSYTQMASQRRDKYNEIHGKFDNGIIGVTTGFAPLDEAVGGLISGDEESDYFLVFAPSNMGKTLISSFMLSQAWAGTPEMTYPAYFALEQREHEIARNWDNIFASISSKAIQRGTLTGEQRDRYVQYLDELQQRKKDMVIYGLDSNGGKPYTVQQIHRILESEGHSHFVLDQLSKVRLTENSMGGGDLRQRLFDTSAEVRNMILDTKIGGYVVAQANRDSARRVKKSLTESEVTGEDIGETYAIYQDASKGISIIKIDDTTFKIQVIKNRVEASGQNFLVKYMFDTGLVQTLASDSAEIFF